MVAVAVLLLQCGRLFLGMARAVVVGVGEFDDKFELHQLGLRSAPHLRTADTAFLQQRFPQHCPHHLLWNLLDLHYSRHPSCSAAPFTDEQCQHGSHSRPVLPEQIVWQTAPAQGAVIHLPFGLSFRAATDGAIVAGCADCVSLCDGDCCGSCRRLWRDGRPVPAHNATGFAGRNASLAAWRGHINLPGDGIGEGPGEGEDWNAEEEEGGAEEEWIGEEDKHA